MATFVCPVVFKYNAYPPEATLYPPVVLDVRAAIPKAELLAPDVFVYYLQAGCWNGSRFEKRGNVTLLR